MKAPGPPVLSERRQDAVDQLHVRALALRRAVCQALPFGPARDTVLGHLEAAVGAAIDAIRSAP